MRGPRKCGDPPVSALGLHRANPVCAAPARGAHARPWPLLDLRSHMAGPGDQGAERGYCRTLQRWPKRGREGGHWAEG